jgi:hypothetical protein
MAAGAPADEIDFDRDIRPILSENCYHCHGPDAKKREAELRLDTRDGLFAKRDEIHVVVPGKPGDSELLRRITSSDEDERMPPAETKLALTETETALIRSWIESGAPWNGHWSFEPIVRPDVPKSGRDWARNEIDHFVFARLHTDGKQPSQEASKERLLRRVTLDLTGLPPTIEDIDAFLADESPTAYETIVNRLLSTSNYGERMAWDWLDAARYADSNGFQGDRERTMFPWRTWVIRSLNANMPFDQFTIEQLSGDLIPDATPEQNLATGFLRNHMINGEGGRIAEENRIEYLFDQTETVATVWLGLTMTCARCHDHKYDPLLQSEYYKLVDFFNQTPVNGGGGDPNTAPVIEVPYENGKVKVMVMRDMPNRRKTFVLTKGLYNQPTETVVTAGFPGVLPNPSANPQDKTPETPAPRSRLDLARWLVDTSHPLTARVTVNRHWQKFFGHGFVKSSEDFGTQGQKPSHPRLLDWLAADFVESGWDVKALHKKIVMSATYRQTAKAPAEAYKTDPDNRLLARGPRSRLPSWMLRDQALAASGLLVHKIGGPSVKPYQPAGVWAEATFGKKRYNQDHGENLYRRSLYTFWRRIIGPTMFFDVAKRQTCAVKTARTNTPLHALVTLNDITYVEAARALAQRVMQTENEMEKRIVKAFRLCATRRPQQTEINVLANRLKKLQQQYSDDAEATADLLKVGESPRDEKLDAVQHAAFTNLCLLILNLDETLSR